MTPTPAAGAAPTAPESRVPGRRGYGFGDVLASEWTKLVTLRSTYWTLLITVGLGIGIGALVSDLQARHFATESPFARLTFDPTRSSLAGMLFAQLVFGVLGVLVLSGEYSTGTIRATFAATPRRVGVLVAKALIVASSVFVVGEVLCFASFFLGQWIIAGLAPSASLGDPGVLRAVLGAGCYLTVLALIALGLAAIVRHTAAAISAFVAVLFVLPVISDALPVSVSSAINPYLPANIGVNVFSPAGVGTNALPPFVGLGVLCAYAAGVLVIGTVLLVRRDA